MIVLNEYQIGFLAGFETSQPHPLIEEMIALSEPLNKVLKYISLQCIINHGFKNKVLEHYYKEILQVKMNIIMILKIMEKKFIDNFFRLMDMNI